jgi:predicted chitinase
VRGWQWQQRQRGWLQVSWTRCHSANVEKTYQTFDAWLKVNHKDKYKDVIANPNVLDNDKELYVLSAMWFWDTNKLNNIADKGNIDEITLKINNGGEGKKERKNYTNQLKQQLK